jgi:hypothetical protein
MMGNSLLRVVCAVAYTLLAVWLLLALVHLGTWLLVIGLAVLAVVITTKRLWAPVLLGLWLGLH